ncbi:MAG: cation:proton antiporter, partial [Gemmatimonadota bacterium]
MVGRGRTSRGRYFRRLLLLGAGFWFLLGGGVFRSAPDGSGESAGAVAEAAVPVWGGLGGWIAEAGTQEAESHGVAPAGQDQTREQSEADDSDHGTRIRDVFFVLILILLSGKILGEIVERRGQPAVLGELVAGVILGGSVLGVIPDPGTEMYEIIHVFAEIGVSILLFEIGLETDLKEMFSVGRSASAVALVGVAVPFGLGFFYWYTVNPAIGIHPEGISFAIVAIFVGATLTATSVGITARVLSDLD